MATTNPAFTGATALRYPTGDDDPDVPGDMLNLATDVNANLTKLNTSIAANATKLSALDASFNIGHATVTCDSAGKAKINHNLGRIPVSFTASCVVGGTTNIQINWFDSAATSGDNTTTTQLTIRAQRIDTGAAYVGSLKVSWVIA